MPSPPVIRITSASKSCVAVVDRMVDALRADRVVLGGRRGAEHLGAARLRDLGRGDPDAARRRLDQQPVALAHPPLITTPA